MRIIKRKITDAHSYELAIARLEELESIVNAGVQNIRQGKGIAKKNGETTEQFFERLCTE